MNVLLKMIRTDFDVTEDPREFSDLTYEQLIQMIEAISDPETEEEVEGYYVGVIDCTLPGSEVTDLIFWPNEWFRDSQMSEIDLNAQEIANYLLAWSEKRLKGSEKVVFPEIPQSKREGRLT